MKVKIGRTDKSDPKKLYAIVVGSHTKNTLVFETLAEADHMKRYFEEKVKDPMRIVSLNKELFESDPELSVSWALQDLEKCLKNLEESKETQHKK